jgi:AmmeMemoRadiSam system protein B
MQNRKTAVAGTFYPADPRALRAEIDEYLRLVEPTGPAPKALIVPHAGYRYSGPVAASAYGRVRDGRGRITRVVLLGPAHRVCVRGMATSTAEFFDSPLGPMAIDREAVASIEHLPRVQAFDRAHEDEHSLEVQVPFIQATLGDVKLVPIAVGDATVQEVASVLEALWGGPETLIVISSDLSHYLDYEAARALDAETTRAVEELAFEKIGEEQACGRVPLRGLLAVAGKRGLHATTLDLRNSGDTSGKRDWVVGYGAWAVQ